MMAAAPRPPLLVATDFSPSANLAVDRAALLAAQHDWPLHLAHAIAPGFLDELQRLADILAGDDLGAVDDLGFFHHTDTEAGQVVVFAFVHAWHFSGFTADQRTAGLQTAFGDTVNDAGRGIHVQFAGRVIIEEEQRLSTLNHQVVYTHRDQIDTDCVVTF